MSNIFWSVCRTRGNFTGSFRALNQISGMPPTYADNVTSMTYWSTSLCLDEVTSKHVPARVPRLVLPCKSYDGLHQTEGEAFTGPANVKLSVQDEITWFPDNSTITVETLKVQRSKSTSSTRHFPWQNMADDGKLTSKKIGRRSDMQTSVYTVFP